jgi:tRNA(Arg) A34 adenosine deaminase TadA
MKINLTSSWLSCWNQAWQAYCDETIPIGAVVVGATGQILSEGRNRNFGSPPHDSRQIYNSPLAHAEINALLALDFDVIAPYSCAFYTLVEPCPLCIGAICMAHIKEIHYACHDPWAGSTNLLQTTPYLRRKNIKVVEPENTQFETAILALNTDFAMRFQQERFQKVVDRWVEFNHEKTRKAMAIYENGILFDMKGQSLSSEKVLFELSKHII